MYCTWHQYWCLKEIVGLLNRLWVNGKWNKTRFEAVFRAAQTSPQRLPPHTITYDINTHLSQTILRIRWCLSWGVFPIMSEYSVSKETIARWLSQCVSEACVLWAANLSDEAQIYLWLSEPCLHQLPLFPYHLMLCWKCYVITNLPHFTNRKELMVTWLLPTYHDPSQNVPSGPYFEPVFGCWPCKWTKWEQWLRLASWAAQCENPTTDK